MSKQLQAQLCNQSAEYHTKIAESTRKALDKIDSLRSIYPDTRSERQYGTFRSEWYDMLDDCLPNLYN